jgi:hypothetical protein
MPGPDRPTDPRDDLVQALLGLRWALPRTDADARVALDQLAAVAGRVGQLAADHGGPQSPWDGQVQALLAQAGFALDWWRPVLDDVDLDWTLNHQAHLSADLARIASAGARILDQYAPNTPHPAATPPSAVTEGPPQPAPRVAAAFGSVPATAVVDPLANSGRHRRPAYEFDDAEALPHGQPVLPLQFEPWSAPPQAPAAPLPQPGEIEPELEQLFRPPQQQAPQPHPEAQPVPQPQRAAAGGPPPGVPAPPPAAFTRPEPTGAIGQPDRRGPHVGMVVQAVGILGVVAALSWWAVSSLHPSSGAAGHASAQSGHASAQPGGGASAHPAGSASAKPHQSSAPATAPSSTHSAVVPVTTPPTSPPPPNAAGVTAIQVELLGGSATVHQVAMVLSVDTTGTGQVTVTVDYWGTKNGAKTNERTASWTLSGKTAYSIGASIPVDAYCGETFTLKAVSGGATATKATSPGC